MEVCLRGRVQTGRQVFNRNDCDAHLPRQTQRLLRKLVKERVRLIQSLLPDNLALVFVER